MWLIPEGMRDHLPAEAATKRWLEHTLTSFFRSWGYAEVIPPTLEYDEVFSRQNQFRLIDRTGQVLALRPDLTTPVARMAATRLEAMSLPLRLFYCGQVFRHQNSRVGSLREFYQAGVELMGAKGAWADAEVISLAVEALQALGLAAFQISLGQVEIITRLLTARLEPGQVAGVKEALARKDYVEVQHILKHQGLPWQLTDLQGGREVLERLLTWLPEEEGALQELAEVWSALEKSGLAAHLTLDFTLVRDLDYYTGIVFEIYAPGSGFPIGGGGRYDGLVAKFGRELAAVGFAFRLERLLEALGEHQMPAPEVDWLVGGQELGAVLAAARHLRQQGQKVEIWLEPCSAAELAQTARQRGIREHIYVS